MFRIQRLNTARSASASKLFVIAPFSRTLTSVPALPDPVKLDYELVEPSIAGGSSGEVLVICHGLFGSKQNWRSLSRGFAKQLNMPVYALDLRNHGTSPHASPHSYLALASDISLFFKDRGLGEGQVHLMGHSMGGKAVMTVALHPQLNKHLKSLISVDMSPAVGKISTEFSSYVDGMLEVEAAEADGKTAADKILHKYEPELSVRQFLLTNSVLKDKKVHFRVPLLLLKDSIPEIGAFPFQPGDATFTKPTMFIKGEHSKYLNHKNIPIAEKFFPNMILKTLPTGHWVHAERPKEFMKLVDDFVKSV